MAVFDNIFNICTHRNNSLRLCILRVVQNIQKHFEKITVVHEFTEMIFKVVHSNDPMARAITLRYYILVIIKKNS